MYFIVALAVVLASFTAYYVKIFLKRNQLPEMTLEELAKFDGKNGIAYVAIKYKIFDVSSAEAYLAGGNYSVFAGKDATVALARMSLSEDQMNITAILNAKEKKTLQEWVDFYEKRKKYPVVARLSTKPKSQ